MQYQAGTNHPDPVHATAHFLRPTTPGAFEVHIQVIKTGRNFRLLTAKLLQDVSTSDELFQFALLTVFTGQNTDVILVQVICGVLQPEDDTSPGGHSLNNLTLAPPSPFTVQTPLLTHPVHCKAQPPMVTWTFKERVVACQDPVYERQIRDAPAIGGVETGEYFTLTSEEEQLTLPMLGFFADCFLKTPLLLPALQGTL